MLKSFARIFHQLIALALLALILLAALFALASLSNTTIADLLNVPFDKSNAPTAGQTSKFSPDAATQPQPTETAVAKPKLSLGLVANTKLANDLESSLITLQQSNVDAIFLLGNVTQTGSVEELRAVKTILDNVRLPTYFIPGTDDLKTPFLSSIFGFRPNSQMYQEVDLAGARILLIDNADPTVGIAPEQWNWLATTLAKANPNSPSFIFLHTRLQTTPEIEPQNAELDRLFASASPSAIVDASMVDTLAILDVFEDNTWIMSNVEIRN